MKKGMTKETSGTWHVARKGSAEMAAAEDLRDGPGRERRALVSGAGAPLPIFVGQAL